MLSLSKKPLGDLKNENIEAAIVFEKKSYSLNELIRFKVLARNILNSQVNSVNFDSGITFEYIFFDSKNNLVKSDVARKTGRFSIKEVIHCYEKDDKTDLINKLLYNLTFIILLHIL